MQTIIAATNFSPASINAVNYAADMASVMGSRLCLLHVFPYPMTFSEVPAPANSLAKMEEDAKQQMQDLKEKTAARVNGSIDIDTEVRTGYVIPELEDYCEHMHPYAVVVGAESSGALERFFLGGRTTSAIEELNCPVIVVPPEAHFTNIRKIGLACDLRNVVETIPFNQIKSLVNEFKAELHIIHINEVSQPVFDPDTISESGWLQDILGELKPKYHFIKYIKENEMEKGITDFAEQQKIDLLITVPKKHNFLSKLFQHSHSKRLVLQAHVPVLSIHE